MSARASTAAAAAPAPAAGRGRGGDDEHRYRRRSPSRSRSRSRSPPRRRRSPSSSPPPRGGGRAGGGGGGGGYRYQRSPSRSPSPRRANNHRAPAAHSKEEEELLQLTRDARTVFVGQLVVRATERDVREYFEQVGPVAAVQLIRDKSSGRSKGIGYVEFEDLDVVPKALLLNGHNLCMKHAGCSCSGFPLLVKPAEAEKNYAAVAEAAGGTTSSQALDKRAYVGNLAPTVTEGDLKALASLVAPVDKVLIVRDARGHSRGYAYVQFSDGATAVRAAQSLHNTPMGGRPISVGRLNNLGEVHCHDGARFLLELGRSRSGLTAQARASLMQQLSTATSAAVQSMGSALLAAVQSAGGGGAASAADAATGPAGASAAAAAAAGGSSASSSSSSSSGGGGGGGAASTLTDADIAAMAAAALSAPLAAPATQQQQQQQQQQQPPPPAPPPLPPAKPVVAPQGAPSRCFVLLHAFGPDDAQGGGEGWQEELEDDVAGELRKHGKISDLRLDDSEVGVRAGAVYVKMTDVTGAILAATALAGRQLGGQVLQVSYMTEAEWDAKMP